MTQKEKRQEIANTLTHLAGIILFLAFLPFLIIKMAHRENLSYLWSVLIFSFGLMMVYCSSTIYHYVRKESVKKVLRVWDHASIYFLIGGTYTPLVAKFLPFHTALWFLIIMWSIIGMGVILKLFFTGRFELLSLGSYLFLGWMALFVIKDFIHAAPDLVLYLIFFGGLAYSLGVIFYIWKKIPYNHAIWHLFVLAGSLFHFFAIQQSF